jgi:hypothetical protein
MYDDILREKLITSGIEQTILKWNSRFRYDRFFRKKYGIRFNSQEHREINQIDIFFELFEDRFFEKILEDKKKYEEGTKSYKATGLFLNESQDDNDDEAIFEKLKINKPWRTKKE